LAAAPRDPTASRPAAPNLTFEQNIRPILKAHCFDCHGEGEKLKGGLDLRLRRLIVAGGESGPAIVPGNPAKSLLVDLITKREMPRREKKLTDVEIAAIRNWVAAGARTERPEPQQIAKGMVISEEDRNHWAFQPIHNRPIPSLPKSQRGLARTPIDAFLLKDLRARRLSFSPDASRTSLIRRAWFDLLGVPPSPEEVTEFLSDHSSDACERLVGRLLDSPKYGERWARHWLDIAGYADSDGYTETDPIRPFAYKYRDYVIGALNSDKPFDQFVIEQLAGDELVGPPYKNLTPAQVEKLTATGFLRMAVDGTGTPGVDQEMARNQVISDTIKIVSTSLLGLSVGCAQCHDHRYDPIPQSDYYRLRALLEPAYDCKNWRVPAARLVSLASAEDRARSAAVETEASKLVAEKEAKSKEYISAAFESHLKKKYDPSLHEPLRAAFHTPAAKRTPEQKKLLDENPSVNINQGLLYMYDAKASDELKALDTEIAKIRARKPPEEMLQALTENSGTIPVSYLFHRGDPKQPKDPVPPGALTVLSRSGGPISFPQRDPHLPTTGRRLAFARWLVSTNDPLLPRVIVNRVWMHHFGRGLVGTPADFGMAGEKPTHPDLLDWLTSDFVAHGWSLKHLHRLIMTSSAYRQSSLRHSNGDTLDPDNRLYWRMPVQRLDAESLRDSILSVSGFLTAKQFGPAVPVREDIFGQVVVGIDKKVGDDQVPVEVPIGAEEFRRSIYVQVRRTQPLAVLNSFDAPVMEVNCERRPSSTVAPQSLMLMNSDFILKQSLRFAARLRSDASSDTRAQLTRAWWLAFSRAPTAAELQLAEQFLSTQLTELRHRASQEPPPDPKAKSKPAKKIEPELQALADVCQTLLSSSEFLYID
jgi:mono/diheme cytochrome c family protein